MKISKLAIVLACGLLAAGCQSREQAEAIKQANETAKMVQEQTAKTMDNANKMMEQSMGQANQMMENANKQMEAAQQAAPQAPAGH